MGQSRRGETDVWQLEEFVVEGHAPFDETECSTPIGDHVIEALREIGLPIGEGADEPIAWQLLGHCLEEMGKDGTARRCYERAARQMVRGGGAHPLPGPSSSERRRHRSTPMTEPLPFAVFQDAKTHRDH